ncbi:MAG TPA: iron ABC transporter substrate-binding protein, partial [Anaeromyxobacteraceae bacterium]|nr:iron ABC transporter substrate-binding protein [Anaeromyxobacteraceae bacterium]
ILRQRAQVAPDDAGVQALVASGQAAFGLAGSEQGAAGAASAAGLEVVYPDQGGFGTLVFPTAAAITQRGLPAAAVHSLAGWMSGADAEQLLAARVPGLLPLRKDVPLPVGVRSAADLRSPQMDWNRLAEVDKTLTPQVGRIVKP